jgi:uncharacterized protein (TIGR02246 family)
MTTDDDRQLNALFTRACAAWTSGDAKAYGDCFTEDADYVSYDGAHAIGRRPVVESHDRLFRGVLTGSALVGEVASIRYVAPDVALMYASGSVLMPWRSRLPKRRRSIQTLVAVRGADGWRFTANHTGRVRPLQIPAPDSFLSKVSRGMTRLAGALGIGHAVTH